MLELCTGVNQQNCPRNDGRAACRGRKQGPIGLRMSSTCASGWTGEVSLRPRTYLDVAKEVRYGACVCVSMCVREYVFVCERLCVYVCLCAST